MKKLFYVLALFVATSIALHTSAQSWGYAVPGHWANDIAEAPDGSVYAAGYAGGDPFFGYSVNYLVKISSTGEMLWTNEDISLPFLYFSPMTLMASSDGVVVFGVSDYGKASFYKLNADGTLAWTSSDWSSGLGYDYIYQGTAAELSDGRFVAVGLTYEMNYQITEVSSDGELIASHEVATDTTGGWAWSYYDFKETGILATADGGFAFSGGRDGFRILHKFDSDINLEWSQYYAHTTDTWEYGQFTNGLRASSDGGYLLAGSSIQPLGTYAGSLRKIDADGNLEWLQYYNHGSDIEEGSFVIEMGSGAYVIWTQDAGDNSSYGWVLDSDGNEIDSLFIPIINCTWGWGETGMEIWDVEAAADGGYIIAGRQYLEDCDQRFTVIKSNADGTYPDCIFNCVWPGDANNDGLADGSDLFEIGINYGAEGFTRTDDGIDWEGKLSRAWMEEDTLFWYILNDLKYTDCNGDGIINDDDTTAVVANLGLDHPLNDLRTSAGEVTLFFDPAFDELSVGLNQIPIMLGDALNPVDEIYGIRFTITAEGAAVEGASMQVVFPDSWLATSAEKLSISKTNGDDKIVVSGIVRKDRNNTEGYGQIARLDVVVIDNISGGALSDEVEFTFGDVQAIKLNRDEVIVTAEGIAFPVAETTDINEATAAGINIYPNPVASETIYIETAEAIISAELTDVTGKSVMMINNLSEGTNAIDVSAISAGQYVLQIHTASHVVNQLLVIQ